MKDVVRLCLRVPLPVQEGEVLVVLVQCEVVALLLQIAHLGQQCQHLRACGMPNADGWGCMGVLVVLLLCTWKLRARACVYYQTVQALQDECVACADASVCCVLCAYASKCLLCCCI